MRRISGVKKLTDKRFLNLYELDATFRDGSSAPYYVASRRFELPELKLLVDAVQSSRFITQKKAKELTDKLKKKASRFDRVYLDRRCYVPNPFPDRRAIHRTGH